MKSKKIRVAGILLLLLPVLGSLFYWYEIRPAQIKHDCSWIKKHSNAIPAREGKTKEQLLAEGKLKVCPDLLTSDYPEGSAFYLLDVRRCEVENDAIVNQNKPQQYVPAKDWYEEATKEEYTFCLHDKGL